MHPSVILAAEDSTSFPKVTDPVDQGGLGFDYKWDMGWMNDTLTVSYTHLYSSYSFFRRYACTVSMISCFACLIFIMLCCPLSFQCLGIQYQLDRPWRHIHIPIIIFHKNECRIIRRHLRREHPISICKVQKLSLIHIFSLTKKLIHYSLVL